MAEEKKKRTTKKKKEVVDETLHTEEIKVEEPVLTTEDISSIIDDSINEVMIESKVEVEETSKVESEKFTTEEKLYILKLISQGYRPFDIVKKARFALNLSEEKRKKLSLDIRTVTQLVNALEDAI